MWSGVRVHCVVAAVSAVGEIGGGLEFWLFSSGVEVCDVV